MYELPLLLYLTYAKILILSNLLNVEYATYARFTVMLDLQLYLVFAITETLIWK